MKVHIEVDMTPEEARKMMGLPDVAPMQRDMMDQMQARMKAAMEAGDPQAMMWAWMPAGSPEAFEQFQKFLWNSAQTVMGGKGQS